MTHSKNAFVVVFTIILFVALSASFLHAQWKKQTTGLPTDFGVSASMDACDNHSAVVSTGQDVFRTIDGGESWHKLQRANQSWYIWDISIIDSLHIWVSDGSGKIFATADGGKNWRLQFADTTLTTFMNYIEMFDLNNGVALGDHPDPINSPGGPFAILQTNDGGATWISPNYSTLGSGSGDTWRRIDFIDFDGGYFFPSGISPSQLYKTMDGGKSWDMSTYSGYVQIVHFYNEKIGLAIPGTKKINRTVSGQRADLGDIHHNSQWLGRRY
jgi:photosystem II stability/assembly factor-like uncharacterized protein